MGAPPIRNGVAIGHFDMTLPRSSQGSERLGQNGERQVGRGEFRVPWWDGENLGAVEMFHTTSFRPHPPCHHPFETSRIHGGSHCSLKGKQVPSDHSALV